MHFEKRFSVTASFFIMYWLCIGSCLQLVVTDLEFSGHRKMSERGMWKWTQSTHSTDFPSKWSSVAETRNELLCELLSEEAAQSYSW